MPVLRFLDDSSCGIVSDCSLDKLNLDVGSVRQSGHKWFRSVRVSVLSLSLRDALSRCKLHSIYVVELLSGPSLAS